MFSGFFIPIESWRRDIFKQPIIIEAMIVLVLGAVLVWVIRTAWKYLSRPQDITTPLPPGGTGEHGSREVISFTTGLYIFAYLASIVASMLMFDAATKFKLRILAPVLVSLLILLVVFGIWLRKKHREVVIVLTLLVLGVSIYKQAITVNTWASSELGYASFQWYDSESHGIFARTAAGCHDLYQRTGRRISLYRAGGYVLPDRVDLCHRHPYAQILKMGYLPCRPISIKARPSWRSFDHGDNFADDVPALTAGLYLAHKSSGDSIYTAHP